jgi:predicted nucleic acid-binding protein
VTPLVVDASVATKWFLPAKGEPRVKEATALLERYTAELVELLVPDFFWAEFANVMWKAVRQSRLQREDARVCIAAMKERELITVSTIDLVEEAFAIACKFNRSAYDSLYIALAVSANGYLVTADERLANAVAAHLPVKWLGSLYQI